MLVTTIKKVFSSSLKKYFGLCLLNSEELVKKVDFDFKFGKWKEFFVRKRPATELSFLISPFCHFLVYKRRKRIVFFRELRNRASTTTQKTRPTAVTMMHKLRLYLFIRHSLQYCHFSMHESLDWLILKKRILYFSFPLEAEP